MWIVWCVRCRQHLCLIGSYVCLWCIDTARHTPPAESRAAERGKGRA